MQAGVPPAAPRPLTIQYRTDGSADWLVQELLQAGVMPLLAGAAGGERPEHADRN